MDIFYSCFYKHCLHIIKNIYQPDNNEAIWLNRRISTPIIYVPLKATYSLHYLPFITTAG
jgi:ABC-type sulfate transport system permease subunit